MLSYLIYLRIQITKIGCVDERIEQKQALLIERVEKLEKTVLELKSELSEIRMEPPRKNEN